MCWLCEKYGDSKHGDGIWYLNPSNYARNMYKLRSPGTGFKGVEASFETGEREGPTDFDLVDALDKGDPQELDRIKRELTESYRRKGAGSQVLPLKDADRVLELSSPIGLISCICRKHVRARDERNELEYTCMGMGVGMLKWERWPERYKGGVKFVNIDEAKEWNHEMDKRGFCHLLMLFGAPYIGGFCQCVYPDCASL